MTWTLIMYFDEPHLSCFGEIKKDTCVGSQSSHYSLITKALTFLTDPSVKLATKFTIF